MNFNGQLKTIASAVTLTMLASTASATITHNDNITPELIFGSGNINGSFTVDRDNGVEIGLRGKLRHNAAGAPENTFNSNGDGTFSFAAGVAPTQSSPTAVWSVEWSINSNFDGSSGYNLDDLTYQFGRDSDASQGTNFFAEDIINAPYYDHAIGTNGTANGGGTVAADPGSYASLIAGNNVAQNSWKAHWIVAPFDPTVDGTYDFYLEAFDGMTSVSKSQIQIIVGNGGAPVPAPAGIALFGLGLLGLGFAKQRKAAKA
jgi:hypothetical protein